MSEALESHVSQSRSGPVYSKSDGSVTSPSDSFPSSALPRAEVLSDFDVLDARDTWSFNQIRSHHLKSTT